MHAISQSNALKPLDDQSKYVLGVNAKGQTTRIEAKTLTDAPSVYTDADLVTQPEADTDLQTA